MPPPTATAVYNEISDFITRHVPEDGNTLFEYEYLATHVRRRFNSTSPAVRERMDNLVIDGDLVQIRVSHSGIVTLDPGLESGMWMLYFGYHQRSRYDSQEWGSVATSRPGNGQNLWANDDRWLYTTAPRLKKMVAHFAELKQEQLERRRQKAKDDDIRFWKAVHATDPDAAELINALRIAAPGIDVVYRLYTRSNGDRPTLSVDTRTPEELTALLGILRRGLAASPAPEKGEGEACTPL